MKIAVCDDNKIYIDEATKFLKTYAKIHGELYIQVYEFMHPFDLAESIEKGQVFDLFLLDILMDGMTGINLAQEIRSNGINNPIIFLTSSTEHALEAFGVSATQYLLKPFAEEMFFSAIDGALEKLKIERRNRIILKSDGTLHTLQIRDILYTSANRNQQIIYMVDGSEIVVRMTAVSLWDILEKFSCFFKCGSSYILNLAHISRLNNKMVLMDNSHELPVPRGAYKALNLAYFKFFSERI